MTDGKTTQAIEVAQVARNVANIDLDQEQMGRLDYQPTEKDHFYLRYIYQDTPLIAYFGNQVSGNTGQRAEHDPLYRWATGPIPFRRNGWINCAIPSSRRGWHSMVAVCRPVPSAILVRARRVLVLAVRSFS